MAGRLATLSPRQLAVLDRRLNPQTVVPGHLLVSQALQRAGVTHVFGVSGSPMQCVFVACAEAGIRICTVHNQQAAVLMAASLNYRVGQMVAAVLLSAGPAVTNSMTGILVARDNCWPVLIIGGRRSVSRQGMGWFQELDAVPMMGPVTKLAATIDAVERLPDMIVAGCRCARSGRPGPVYLDLPEDCLGASGPVPDWAQFTSQPEPAPRPDQQAIENAARLLQSAKRPLLIMGKGARWGNAYELLTRLVDRLSMPFVTSPMGRGLLPDEHPGCMNPVAGIAQNQADTILLVGARLDWVFRFGGQMADTARLVQIDIEAAEIGRNRPVQLGLVGDAGAILERILEALDSGPSSEADDAWLERMRRKRQERIGALSELAGVDTVPMGPHRLVRAVYEAAPDDTLFVVDGNVLMAAAEQVLPAQMPLSRMTAGHNGCMGVGIPFAIAAKMHQPERPVIALCGDYAFSLSAMELETAARQGLPIVVIVANNGGANGALDDHPSFNGVVTTYGPNVRYDRIATAFGGNGEDLHRPDQIGPAVRRALAANQPTCLNVRIDPHAPLPSR